MRILHVSPSFYPAHFWGGPIYSVHGLCAALARLSGVELKVLTTNSAGPRRSDNLSLPENPARFPEGFEVSYCARIAGASIAPSLLRRLRPLVNWADVVHLTGVYSFPTIPTLWLCAWHEKPLVWSPRGALQRWAQSRRRVAKSIWDGLCDLMLSPSRCLLHVTSELEWKTACMRIRNSGKLLAPNGVEIPAHLPEREWRPGGGFRVLYIGRLDPKKGIENLLTALARLPPEVSLTLCGTGEPRYVQSLRVLADRIGLAPRARFAGHVAGEEKTRAFLEADICVVPSHTENFAMVVAEALAHGTPVIASTGTPWQRLESMGAGRWVPNDPASLATALLAISREDLPAMGKRGQGWMSEVYSWDRIARDMVDAYRTLIDSGRSEHHQ